MVPGAFFFFHLLFYRIVVAAGAEPPAYILLNCGDSSNVNDISNRTWNGDDGSRYAPPNAATISTASAASLVDPSVFSVPFERARVFHSPFTYTFPLLTGQKFLRLYFYPAVYTDFDTRQSSFSVTTNGFHLLRNFSAFHYSNDSSQPSFMKEFIISIGENQKLDLTFTPDQNTSAFVNGIEIVSIPDQLYFKGYDVPVTFADEQFYFSNGTVLENLYRLNVGGSRVEIQDDSSGMFRAWNTDDVYVSRRDPGLLHQTNLQIKYTDKTPPYSAPQIVYATSRVAANNSSGLHWSFPVDSGFNYLLRLHFCELFPQLTEQNQRVFTISVNDQIEDDQAYIIGWTKGAQIPIFRDYGAQAPRFGQQDLWLSLLPKHSTPLLNGLEIFKLIDDDSNFAAENGTEAAPRAALDGTDAAPGTEPGKVHSKKKGGKSSVIYTSIGSAITFLAVVAVVSLLVFKQKPKLKNLVPRSATNGSTRPGLPFDLCRCFSFDEIKKATSNFDNSFILGKGGFGDVYKGLIDNRSTTVAIKRLNPSSKQGAGEFFTEIEMLSKLRYVHLVSLIGYCDENGEMMLVYDYMAHGTLRDHLYNSENPPLTWKQRLRICQGAAKGLQYLHAGTNQAIIHRDVKSTNILLNEKWVAKISDFGLSKVGPTGGESQTHVTTAVKGSFGYVDPEYYRWQHLTEKSDVYSFGVVLLEVLCARPALNTSLPREQANLAEWVKSCVKEGTLKQMIDSTLDGQIAQESLNKFVETAMACLKDKGVDRPTMSNVLRSLEFAIQLQEAAEEDRKGSVAGDGEGFVALSSPSPLLGMFFRPCETEGSKTIELSTASCINMMSEDVFSDIKNPLGR